MKMIGTELLDDRRADPRAVTNELRDIARLNTLFGGTRAVVEALQPFFASGGNREKGNGKRVPQWTLLDVGTGSGDIALAAVAAARQHGLALTPIGLEVIPAAAQLARGNGVEIVMGDGGALPFAPKSVDIVIASQVLHHLPRAVAMRWIAGFDRMARRAVVLADLRRSRVAMGGVWLAAYALRMGATTRHDAVVSLRRGYTRVELNAMLREAGVPAVARYRPGFRIVATWSPAKCELSTR
jgi:2-polyprenyl-3-methyl-5-hydroxy-6-metoxy-1,4-benzoquinol methylase